MAISASIIDALVASGCTAEQLAAAMKAALADDERVRAEAEAVRRQKNAEKMRRHRERNRVLPDVTVTDGNGEVHPVTPRPPGSPLPSPAPLPTPLNPPTPNIRAVDGAFVRFWQAYPRRGAANPRKTAAEKFALAVRGGADPDALIAAADVYRRECDRLGYTGTPSVAQCQTWFNQRRWEDYAIHDPPGPEAREYPAAAAMLADERADVTELQRIREADGWEAAELFAQQHRRSA